MVETFEPRTIRGWVTGDRSRFPVRVSLFVNEFEVASTWANDPSIRNTPDTARAFSFTVVDLWRYCATTDRVSVRIGGRPIPIAAKGIYKRPGRGATWTLEDLQQKFDEGYLFSHTGRLQLSKKQDLAWQKAVFGLHDGVMEALGRHYDFDAFVIYGSLLGQVREGGFIGHDIDLDLAYLSKFTDGPAAAAELRDVGFALVDEGFDVECQRTALHIHDRVDRRIRIDLFHVYFDEHDRLAMPFGRAGETEFEKRQWAGTTDAQMAGHTVRVPVRPEALVEHIYGRNWRIPIAGFNWAQARTARATAGILPVEYGEEVYWANFYARTDFTTGSSFFETLVQRDDIPQTVVDIGCGDGRDSFAFARTGRRVIGLDRAHVGVSHATRKADQAGLGSMLSFTACDVSDVPSLTDALAEARRAADGGPLLFYMRFFLHSIPEDVQETLLTELTAAALPGDMLAAEFRTDKDKTNPKTFGGHYRRYQNGPAFGSALRERFGFTVVSEEEGTGLAPYKDEDPDLYRAIARR